MPVCGNIHMLNKEWKSNSLDDVEQQLEKNSKLVQPGFITFQVMFISEELWLFKK